MAREIKTLDLTPMKWVQEKHELQIRNHNAEEYSASVRNIHKRNDIKEAIGDFIGGLSIFAMLYALYMVGTLL